MEGKPSSEIRYAFVGGGIIATVFIERLITSGAAGADSIIATDNRAERLSALKDQFRIAVSANNADAGGFADVVFIAVPPPAVPGVLNELRPSLKPDVLVISLAAAVPIALMKSAAGESVA
jgi:pyrroline-5-carboxylate reductase